MDRSLLLALLVGALQGVLEWLPVSSEGGVALLLTVAADASPAVAIRLSLFLHAGTALAAAVYYRRDLRAVLGEARGWRPQSAFSPGTAALSFLAVATVVSGAVGIGAYLLLVDAASGLAGGAFVALVGVLLVATGLLQRVAAGAVARRERPDGVDAVLVGVLQGLAVLPGVSRSGTTAGALLLRGHDGVDAFRLSFLLSIPAALGAGVLAALDGGVPSLAPADAAVALGASAAVGYLTIGLLVRLVRRVAFWGVCVGFGALAVVGGLLAAL